MHFRGFRAGLLLASSAIAFASAAYGSETTTYTYDALGRLVATSSTGTVNNGAATSLGYDPAGNRSSYSVTGAAGPPPSPPPPPPPSPPPPPPPPANNPPTAVDNIASQTKCSTGTYDVVADDSDVDGDYPLSLVSVSGQGFSVVSATELQFVSTSSTGPKTGTYIVRDSRGATAGATLKVTVSGGTCNPPPLPATPQPVPPPPGTVGS